MFCITCGTKNEQLSKFCGECGSIINKTATQKPLDTKSEPDALTNQVIATQGEPTKNCDKNNIISDVKKALNNCVSTKTSYVIVEDYLENNDPFKTLKGIFILLGCIGVFFNVAITIIFLPVIYWFTRTCIASTGKLKSNKKEYSHTQEIDYLILTKFLRYNLQQFQLTHWEKSKDNAKKTTIYFTVDKLTDHRIVFNLENKTYKVQGICLHSSLLKCMLKRDGRDTAVYKSIIKTNILVLEVINYYLANQEICNSLDWE